VKLDVSSGVMRQFVPKPLREEVFTAIHNLAHPGVRATRRLIASRYLWPGLANSASGPKRPGAAHRRAANPCTGGEVYTHPCGRCGPLTSVRRGVSVPLYSDR
jgi:hypothetical protein